MTTSLQTQDLDTLLYTATPSFRQGTSTRHCLHCGNTQTHYIQSIDILWKSNQPLTDIEVWQCDAPNCNGQWLRPVGPHPLLYPKGNRRQHPPCTALALTIPHSC